MRKITFVLPGRNRSGGVRATVEMANRLLGLGYDVRIAYHVHPLFAPGWPLRLARNAWVKGILHLPHTDWVQNFKGKSEKFTDLRELRFSVGEVVIAVGVYTVHYVNQLKNDVIKVRYEHGFSMKTPELTRSALAIPMTTIAVSSTMIALIEELSKGSVSAIVPNGVDQSEYFIEDGVVRNGVGLVYSGDPVKSPQDAVHFVQELRARMPHLPQHYFGSFPKPREFRYGAYVRYPSVAHARRIYNKCLTWVSVSREEGFGLPILEAMACGCAVVSADNLGARELIRNGENGLLVPVGDIDGFCAAVHRLFTEPTLRENIVRAGLETVDKFSWENAVEKMNAFLKRLPDGHNI